MRTRALPFRSTLAALFVLAAIGASPRAQQTPPPKSDPAPKPPPSTAPAATPDAAAATADAAKGRMESLTFESKVLGSSVDARLYLPAGYDAGTQRYPVVYFLHGLWLSAQRWEQRGTNATLDDLIATKKCPPMIVVCADGKRDCMWIDWKNGKGNWGEFVATELVTTVDAKYRTIADRAHRHVSGESMGGFGALNAAFKHPDVFGAVSTLSAMLYSPDPTKLPPQIQQFAPRWQPVYDWPIDVGHWKQWNPLELASTLPVEQLKKLSIYFDCGDQDRYGFDKTNAQLHAILDERKVPHQWALRSGGHGHDYFEEYVGESLRFHGQLFAAAAKSDGKAEPPAAPPAKPASH
jgi:enterochelin esterase-like enzyme